ncbi:MAG: hypothetical protein ACFB21_03725 [Opitutales bacterium]
MLKRFICHGFLVLAIAGFSAGCASPSPDGGPEGAPAESPHNRGLGVPSDSFPNDGVPPDRRAPY